MTDENKTQIANDLPQMPKQIYATVQTTKIISKTDLEVEREKRMKGYIGQLDVLYKVHLSSAYQDKTIPSAQTISEFYERVLAVTRVFVNEITVPSEKVRFLETIEGIDLAVLGTNIPQEIATKFNRAVQDMKKMSEYSIQKDRTSLTTLRQSIASSSENDQIVQSSQQGIEKIKWEGSNVMLLYLVKQLFDSHLISKSTFDRRHSLIVQHFVNKNGESFTIKNLQTSEREMKENKKFEGKPMKSKVVEDAIVKVKEC